MTELPPPPHRSDPAGKPPEPPRKREPGTVQQLGLATMIPMLLLAGPLVGYALGEGLRRWLGWPEWVQLLMVILGLVAGVRESIDVIKRISR